MGEQADYLRFMPEQKPGRARRWWMGVLIGGPGWVLQYPATGGSNPNTLLNCAQAAQMGGGGGCQLPTNMKH